MGMVDADGDGTRNEIGNGHCLLHFYGTTHLWRTDFLFRKHWVDAICKNSMLPVLQWTVNDSRVPRRGAIDSPCP
jgi:hypothetical protein